MSEEHKNCKYRFKCKSCEDCPLNCKFKRLQEENKELKEKQIINDIDKLDGMVKIKGKCGYEFIGGCRELKKYKQALEEIRKIAQITKKDICDNCGWQNSDCCEPQNYTCNEFIKILDKINEVLK